MSPTELIGFFYVFAWAIVAIPAFVVGRRCDVKSPWVAFVPFVGATIVILRSIDSSAWLALLVLIPLANLILSLWLTWIVPVEHGRTRWWTLVFIIPLLNFVAFYAYAFTLRDKRARGSLAVQA